MVEIIYSLYTMNIEKGNKLNLLLQNWQPGGLSLFFMAEKKWLFRSVNATIPKVGLVFCTLKRSCV